MTTSIKLTQEIWIYLERLYIHCYSADEFIILLKKFNIDYSNPLYKTFTVTETLYTFMSQPNYDFANFMQTIPTYKYITILQNVVFDDRIAQTRRNNWNYYGEYIKNWHPKVVELLRAAGVEVDVVNRKLKNIEIEEDFESPDFLPYNFNDLFLDYIRKEINESYNNGLLLATILLSRKLLEALTIRIMEVCFPKTIATNHELWYDLDKKRYRFFSEILENIKFNIDAFDEDKDLVSEMCDEMDSIRKNANKYVHSDYKIPDEKTLKDVKLELTVSKVRKIFIKYCNP